MLSKSTLLHLRFPFSFFLMPVFGFALVLPSCLVLSKALLIFFIWHLLVYPASNGFNSYFDKDEESIGGLEKPPLVSKGLYFSSLFLDVIALLLSLLVNITFFVGILIYGLASKAYSHPLVRLKKYAFLGLFTVGFFQGFFTIFVSVIGLTNDINFAFSDKVLFAGCLSSALLLGSYPMTQIYQHSEDSKRGDRTISILLGIRGTFLFTLLVFGMVGGGYFLFFWKYFDFLMANLFMISLLPSVIFFLNWFYISLKNEKNVNFKNTMRLNLYSALGMNIFFYGKVLIEYVAAFF